MKKALIFGSPILFLVEILVFNTIIDLARQPSDIAVIISVVILCITAFLNYLLIKFIIKLFKTK